MWDDKKMEKIAERYKDKYLKSRNKTILWAALFIHDQNNARIKHLNFGGVAIDF